MKKYLTIATVLIILFALSSCNRKEPELKPDSQNPQQQQDALSVDQAKELILEAVPQLKSDEYELTLENTAFEQNNSLYYRYEIKKSGELLEPVILVDQQTKEIVTCYPEGAIYEIETDPLFGSQTTAKWNGTYTREGSVKEDFVTIEMGMSDQNTFEFTLTAEKDGKRGEIRSQAAQIDHEDNKKAVFNNQDGFRLLFHFEGENLHIASEGLNIYSDASISFDGVYSMESDTVDK